MVASRPLDDDDQVFDAVPCQGVAHPLERRLESRLVVLDDGRFHEDSAVEVSDHHLGAALAQSTQMKAKCSGPTAWTRG